MLSPERAMTEQERAIVQAMVDDLYEQFVAVVAEGRKMDSVRVRQLADGRIYTGRQARAVGLVDEMGSMEEAVHAAANMAGISGKPVLREYGRTGLWEAVFGSSGRSMFETLLGQLLWNRFPGDGPLFNQPALVPQLR
jgi:protease-4